MTFEFIKSLNDVKNGVYYYQDNTGKIEICCYVYDIKITDLENLTVYGANDGEMVPTKSL